MAIVWCITDKIDSDDVVSIDVLIGTNCTEVLEPINFIVSKNEGPYGWCVVRPIESIYGRVDIINCDRVATGPRVKL